MQATLSELEVDDRLRQLHARLAELLVAIEQDNAAAGRRGSAPLLQRLSGDVSREFDRLRALDDSGELTVAEREHWLPAVTELHAGLCEGGADSRDRIARPPAAGPNGTRRN